MSSYEPRTKAGKAIDLGQLGQAVKAYQDLVRIFEEWPVTAKTDDFFEFLAHNGWAKKTPGAEEIVDLQTGKLKK